MRCHRGWLNCSLVSAGHDATHVRASGMHAASDEAILSLASAENRIVVSADSDFGAILAAQEAEHPSFILFRDPNLLSAHEYVDTLLLALPMLEAELMSGCAAVFRRGRLRIRRLPFSE